MAQEAVQSSEDLLLQRMIELEAWYDGEEKSSVAAVEDDLDGDPSSFINGNKNKWKLLWQVDKDEDDPEFSSPSLSAQLPCTHSDMIEELLADLATVEGVYHEETDFVGHDRDSIVTLSKELGDQAPIDHDSSNCATHIGTDSAGDDNRHDQNLTLSDARIHAVTESTDNGALVCEDSPKEKKPRYYHIAHEVLTSERTYVKGLRILEKVVHGAVKTMQLTNKSVVPESAREEIFLNIGEIYALHFDLLRELEAQLEHWGSNSVVALVISKRARFFKLYSAYAKRFDTAREAYIHWLKTSKQFRELIKIIESSRLFKGDHVPSFMILPIQRVPRYKMLLEDYLKHLPEGHPDVVNTKAALAVISETAHHMNSTIVDLEGQALLLKVQKQFVGKDVLLAPGRKFIGRGPVTLVPGSGMEQGMILFLFSDILLVASSTTHGKYKIHHKFSLKNLLVKELEPSSSLKNIFCITEKGASKLFRFCTKSDNERDIWIKKLNEGRTANSDHFTINKRSEHAPVLHDPEAYESILMILNDPSFERSQPSWVHRSSRSSSSSAILPSVVMPGSNAKPPCLSFPQLNVEEVDHPLEEEAEEIKTEFEDVETEERALLTMSLNPGIDNSLSSYINQRSADGKAWRRRWFVLTSQALVCYENHLYDEAVGAIPLAGYKLSLPTEADGVKRCNVLKLTHPLNRTYFFELPSCYDFEKWCAIMRELLESQLNSCY